MRVRNVVAIVFAAAMAFSCMLYEVFVTEKISFPLWIAEETHHRCHSLRFAGKLSESCTTAP